jgi:class 3 adenylate cyclase
MKLCPACGHENSERARFCEECGAALAVGAPPREQRKTVTVLFCDVTGSTALGESVDPEALRALLARYFERMKAIVERHGGSVEKFIGDAVMAVFGVPVVHEDDALRAVRAAVEMREALPELGVQARIGVNTGEVVTGTEERLATGDAVNVAARLEQAAQPGEVLLGEVTLRLVRDLVKVEAVDPLELKGKAEPLTAYRLRAVRDAAERRLETPMIGRETELRRLRDAFIQAMRDRSCQLFTVLGTAGVGKSRLAAEFMQTLTDARVVRGRCLAYGEGITYWPVVEVVKQLDRLPSDKAAAAAIRSLLGESVAATSAEEIAWAFRKLLEEASHEHALVCVLDDLHWGEETFFDLVEHVADLSRDAPLLLLCMARPELLERRPGWGGGKWNATTVLLEPLDSEETDRLLEALGGAEDELRVRIREAAEGNPLFLEEMLALVRESGGREVVVPPTIQALLAARLDQLEPGERSVLERGSVEGRVFHRSAVHALSDGETQLPARLVALVRKELVRPDRAQLPDDDAYRFRHLLIRDAAYDSLPKATRAELHERFAAWLEKRGPDLVELDEIVGYHLEQAARYKDELGQLDAALAERAGERLAVAGRRALWRSDNRAAAGLFDRALELLRPLRLDVELELDFAWALEQSDLRRAAEIADTAAERARQSGDRPGEMLARVVAASYRTLFVDNPAFDHVEALGRAALALLEQAGDHAGLVRVWDVLAMGVANTRWQYEEQAHAAEQALRHARLAGQPATGLFSLDMALVYGPRPADDALQALDAAMPEALAPRPLLHRAWLLAMLCRFDEAWRVAREASERLRELTGGESGEPQLAEIATLAGDDEAAVSYLRAFCDRLQERGERSTLSTYAPRLGRSLCALGRYDEAEPLAQLGRDLGDNLDVATQAWWRQAQALVLAHRGEHAEAMSLAREAVAIAERTDALSFQGYALSDLGEALALAGRRDEAAAALEQALDRYERKRNLAMAAQVRDRLGTLLGGAGVP